MKTEQHILVFKTNIRSNEDKAALGAVLSGIPGVERWSVDCEDVDCVLRVVMANDDEESIKEVVLRNGFFCEYLTD